MTNIQMRPHADGSKRYYFSPGINQHENEYCFLVDVRGLGTVPILEELEKQFSLVGLKKNEDESYVFAIRALVELGVPHSILHGSQEDKDRQIASDVREWRLRKDKPHKPGWGVVLAGLGLAAVLGAVQTSKTPKTLPAALPAKR